LGQVIKGTIMLKLMIRILKMTRSRDRIKIILVVIKKKVQTKKKKVQTKKKKVQTKKKKVQTKKKKVQTKKKCKD